MIKCKANNIFSWYINIFICYKNHLVYHDVLIGLMVKFGLPVFLQFGFMVKNSAFRFSYDSAFQIRPNGPVRPSLGLKDFVSCTMLIYEPIRSVFSLLQYFLKIKYINLNLTSVTITQSVLSSKNDCLIDWLSAQNNQERSDRVPL